MMTSNQHEWNMCIIFADKLKMHVSYTLLSANDTDCLIMRTKSR